MLLSLDISLTTGVSFGGPNDLTPRTMLLRLPDGEENFDRALASMRESVMMLLKFQKVEVVAIEAAMQVVNRFHSAYSALLLISLSAVAREAAQRHGARIMLVSCQTWRKHFIGSGNLPGDQSKRMCMKRCDDLGWAYADNNVAESLGLWHYAMTTVYKKWPPAPHLT